MVITADYQKRWHITALLEEQSQKMTGTTMLSVPATTAQLIIICTEQPEKQTKLPIHLRYFIRMNHELNHLIFKDALTAVKEVYEIP